MNRINRLSTVSLTAVSLAALAAVAGCSAAPGDHASSSQASALSSHPTNLVGSWEEPGPDTAGIIYYSFKFSSDGTYTAAGGCRPNSGCFAITGSEGSWSVQKSGPELGSPGGADEIVLSDSLGQEIDYFYSLSGKTLALSTTYGGPQNEYTKGGTTSGSCSSASDCTGPSPATCSSGAPSWSCTAAGTCEPSCGEDAPTACAAAGGSCVGLAPGSCANGTVGDANTYSCGGGLGLECCLPNAGDDAGPGPAACVQASDCEGALPRSCETCSDGSTGCAQWSCQSAQCVITYCN